MLWSAHEVSPLTPIAPTSTLAELYKANPPPNTFTPPILLPKRGSFGMPKFADGPLYAASVSTGLLCCKPYSEPPGCTAAYKFAVDKARVGKLNELAVFAFWGEMTRLPGHSEPRSAPAKPAAQTTPSRLTMVPHISRSNPPLAAPRALESADLRAE